MAPLALAAPWRVWVRCTSHASENRRRVRVRALENVEDDDVLWLTSGTEQLPPLVEATMRLQSEASMRVVKPPGVDELWDWYEQVGSDDADPSWGRVWKTASDLSNLVQADALPSFSLRRKELEGSRRGGVWTRLRWALCSRDTRCSGDFLRQGTSGDTLCVIFSPTQWTGGAQRQ